VTQTSFADWYAAAVVNNEVTRDHRFANGEWQFHPRWSIGAGAAEVSSTNSTAVQAPNDYEDTSVHATLGYTTPKGSKLRGQLRQVDGEYPNRPASLFVDRAYTLTEYNLLGDWNVEGKLVAHGKIGYVQRENETLSHRNFSGLAGRLSADYFVSGKTMLNWALYREIANSDDFNASYQLRTGTNVGVAWLAAPKLTLRANAGFENRSFEGDTGAVTTQQQRDEDTLSGSVSLSYAPTRMAIIDVGVQAGRRDSNIPVSDYSFHSVFASVRADF
jgi:exopolysaccharide biosynthesis operon protein EpsL